MKKEELLSYIEKGDINHKGYIINVKKTFLKRTKVDFIEIELKPINKYTDSAYHKGILNYLNNKQLENIEESFKKEYEIMKEQGKIADRKPKKLFKIPNINQNYIASFKDDEDNKYVLMETTVKDKYELVFWDKEPVYSIKEPIEINGNIIKSNYSFWLSSGVFNANEVENALKEKNINIKNVYEEENIIESDIELE